MSISKRLKAVGYTGPHPLAGWTLPGGAPLVMDDGETVTPSQAPGWVAITGHGRPRFTRAEPVADATPLRQAELF